MLHRILAHIGFGLKYPRLISKTHFAEKAQWFPYDQLKRKQEQELIKLIAFAHANVPYYRKSFDRLGLAPEDIKTIKDLEKLPIVNKKIIKENWEDFIPGNLSRMGHVNRATSGSTGMPFQYRLSRTDLEYSIALIFRGRGFAGYRLGDKLAILSSRMQPAKLTFRRRLTDFTVNQRTYSCFNINQEKALRNFEALNRFKPSYILSSPLSLSVFAKFILDNNLKMIFKPKAIFTNGEKLFDNQRSTIEKVMHASVFDIYGLDDGGISANECEQHCGLHIDMERGILEVVNAEGAQIVNAKGKILATSLRNFALPFIRFETGDLGIIMDKPCVCGRKTQLLQEITGRIEGYITTPSGVKIHGATLAEFLSHMESVHQFQVVQNKPDEVVIRVVPASFRRTEDINIGELKAKMAETDKNLNINLQVVSEEGLEYTKAGKYKFVINNLSRE